MTLLPAASILYWTHQLFQNEILGWFLLEGEDEGGKIGPNFSKGCEMTLDFDNGDVFCEKKCFCVFDFILHYLILIFISFLTLRYISAVLILLVHLDHKIMNLFA